MDDKIIIPQLSFYVQSRSVILSDSGAESGYSKITTFDTHPPFKGKNLSWENIKA